MLNPIDVFGTVRGIVPSLGWLLLRPSGTVAALGILHGPPGWGSFRIAKREEKGVLQMNVQHVISQNETRHWNRSSEGHGISSGVSSTRAFHASIAVALPRLTARNASCLDDVFFLLADCRVCFMGGPDEKRMARVLYLSTYRRRIAFYSPPEGDE